MNMVLSSAYDFLKADGNTNDEIAELEECLQLEDRYTQKYELGQIERLTDEVSNPWYVLFIFNSKI